MTEDEQLQQDLDSWVDLVARPKLVELRRGLENVYNVGTAELQRRWEHATREHWPPVPQPPPVRHRQSFKRLWQFVKEIEEGSLKPRQ